MTRHFVTTRRRAFQAANPFQAANQRHFVTTSNPAHKFLLRVKSCQLVGSALRTRMLAASTTLTAILGKCNGNGQLSSQQSWCPNFRCLRLNCRIRCLPMSRQHHKLLASLHHTCLQTKFHCLSPTTSLFMTNCTRSLQAANLIQMHLYPA